MKLHSSCKPLSLRLSGLAFVSLCLLMSLGCSSAKVGTAPPVIEVPTKTELPADCKRTEKVETKGASALEIMERQHAAILRLEDRLRACTR